ncbi:MAG TPA: GNAT family N-acetyltransferase [Enhygromyxa sp.]|nr:GNAT family N-acetyltransferase [Enhygromyxa sp.]
MYTIDHQLGASHRPQLEGMLRATESLNEAEVAVALELIDLTLENPGQSDYRFLLARGPAGLAGYVCYGPTPMTDGTYDLYWLVTHPEQRRRGVARMLVVAMEQRLRSEGARLVRVETSSLEGYGAARRFYRACAYQESAVLREFYRPGDDLIIFIKALQPGVAGRELELAEDGGGEEFEGVFDLAFSYRDFEFERDFLRACARTHGRGEPQRVLEWACGPSRHLRCFAALPGVEGVGVDISPAMVDLGRRRIGGAAALRIERGDMREHVVSPPVDLAYAMLSSIHTLARRVDLLAHLRTCAESLRPGGVYVFEATHPRDLEPGGVASSEWEQRRGDVCVTGRFALDLRARVGEQVPVSLELILEHGDRQREYRVKQRWLVPGIEQWRALVGEVPGLELVASYGDFDLHTPAHAVTAWRLILVLRRERAD